MPGPGQYSSDMKAIKDSAPGYKLGTSKRGDVKGSEAPGPGQYNISQQNKQGAVFGRDERTGKGAGKGSSPGPGQY